jgi:hypothetical protein
MRVLKGGSLYEYLAAVVLVVAIGAVALFFLGPTVRTIQCDGSVPTWMITEENANTGCVELLSGPPPDDWDGSWVCIGLCTVPDPSPFYPRSQLSAGD